MAKSESNGKSPEAEKVAKPFAPTGKLPELPAGCEWDSTEIGPFQFAIPVAKNMAGISALAKSEEKAVGLFNRAWRILVPQAIDARATEKSKMDAKWAENVQKQILNFDPAAVRTRAPRTPPTVEVPKDKKSFTLDELKAMFGDRINIVTK